MSRAPMSAAALEIERPRARQFHRPADPEGMFGGAEHRLASIGSVEQHAEARPASATRAAASTASTLNSLMRSTRRADLVGHRFELRAVIDGERHQRVRLAAGASSPNGRG